MSLKPGDLVEPDWGFRESVAKGNNRQLGLVLSYPETPDDRTTVCVKVNWLGYDLIEYYSLQHLKLVNDEQSV